MTPKQENEAINADTKRIARIGKELAAELAALPPLDDAAAKILIDAADRKVKELAVLPPLDDDDPGISTDADPEDRRPLHDYRETPRHYNPSAYNPKDHS